MALQAAYAHAFAVRMLWCLLPCSQPTCTHMHSWHTHLVSAHSQQALNVAILKATTSQFHVAPKEKHVTSEHPSV